MKKVMRKVTAFILSCTMLLSTGMTSLAAESVNKTAAINYEIMEYDQDISDDIISLFEACENGTKESTKMTGVLQNTSRSIYETTVYEVQEEIYSSNNERIVANTCLYEIPELENARSSTTGNAAVNKTDSSSSIKGRCTLYYTITTNSDGCDYYKLTKVTGGYTILDSAFSVSGQTLAYGQTGGGLNGGMVNEARSTFAVTGSSWSYSTGFKGSVLLGASMNFGATYVITVKRQSTWTLTVKNILT